MGFVNFGSAGPGEEESVLKWLANPSCLSMLVLCFVRSWVRFFCALVRSSS